MHDSRPVLQEGLNVEDFRRFYWRKDELAPFCRNTGISMAGSKADLLCRVENYLATGLIEKPKAKQQIGRSGAVKNDLEQAPLSLDTPIPPDYRNSQANRAFFESVVGPQFHFTIRFMRFCKENPGRTYRDAINEWYVEREEKKRGNSEMLISSECEYNRFVHSYMATNKGKTIRDAADAWNVYKTMPRDQKS